MTRRSTRRIAVVLGIPVIALGMMAVESSSSAQAPSGASAEPMPGTVLPRAAAYVARFVEAFANVVGEERYTQDILASGTLLVRGRGVASGPTHRDLRSDFLLVKTGGLLQWTAFRDVFEVDGQPVRDRQERLTKLFSQPSPDALEQASRLATESARYNIGATERTINSPVLPLLFLQTDIQPRFRFTSGTRTADFSDRVSVVAYQEITQPTIVRTVRDTDRPASGRFWIESDTGRVLQSELTLAGNGVSARFTTLFEPDDRLGVSVPVRMREEYSLAKSRLVGVATYSGFHRFEVRTEDTDSARLAR